MLCYVRGVMDDTCDDDSRRSGWITLDATHLRLYKTGNHHLATEAGVLVLKLTLEASDCILIIPMKLVNMQPDIGAK
jgi:hypothetical protein